MTQTGRLRIKNYLKISDAAKILGISAQTLRRWDEAGKLETIKSPAGYRLYSKKSLEKLLNLENNIKYKREPILKNSTKKQASSSKEENKNPNQQITTSLDSLVPRNDNVGNTEEMQISGFNLQDQSVILSPKGEGPSIQKHMKDSSLSFGENQNDKISTKDLLETVNHPDHHLFFKESDFKIPKIQPQIQQVQEIKIMQVLSKKSVFTQAKGSFLTFALFTVASLSLIGAFLATTNFVAPEKFTLASLNPFEQKLKDPQEKITKQIASLPLVARNDENGQGQVLQAATSNVLVKIDANTQINGTLTLQDAEGTLTITPTQGAVTFFIGNNESSLTVGGTSSINQNVSTGSTPSFSAIALTSTTNQIVSNSNNYTLPGSSDTLVGEAATQTLTNKTLSGSSNTFSNIPNSALSNSAITINNGSGLSGGGSVSLGGSLTLSVDTSGFVTLTGTQTLTNKTLTSPIINVGNDATGDVYYRNSDGQFTNLPIGSAGQVLSVTAGLPAWEDSSAGGGVTSLNSLTGGLTIAGAGINTVGTSGSTITITGTEADTLATVTGRGATTTTLVNLDGGIAVDTSNFTVSGTTGAISTASTINGLTITNNGTNTLSIAAGKTLTASNTLTLAGTDSTSFTFPSSSGTVVTLDATQTLTNKTLTSPVINVGSDATGDIYYRSSNGLFTRLPIGSSSNVLVVSGGLPSWGNISGSSCTNCLITDPSTSQSIVPTGATTVGLSIRKTSTGGGTPDIFNTTSSDGATKYLVVDSSGNVQIPSTGLVVGNTSIATTALVDLTSTTKGFLAPRMTEAQRDAISSPATGLLIYNTDTNAFNVYYSSAWNTVGGAIKWSAIAAPDANLALNMTTYTTTFNWDTGTGSNDLFSLTSDNSANGTGSLLNIQTGTSSTVVPLRVRAGSVEGLTVDASGNVGLGDTTPAAKFTVGTNSEFQVNTTGQVTFSPTSTTPTANIIAGVSPITPGTTGSYTTTTFLPGPRSYSSATVYNGYLFITAGNNGTAQVSTVYSAPIRADGTLGSFSTLSSLPAGRDALGTTVYNGYLFAVGGYSGANPQSTVYSTRIDSNGAVSNWSTLNYLPVKRGNISIASYNGYLFVPGGNDGSNRQSTVYSAPINPDGTVGTWTTTTFLPGGVRDLNSTVAYNGYLFIIGGTSGSTVSTVYSAPIRADGTLGSFSTLSSLPAVRQEQSSVVNNGYLFVLGGYNGSIHTSTVYSATINADGTLGSWNTLTPLPDARTSNASAVYNGYLFVTGGTTGPSTQSTVYSAPLQSTGLATNTASNFTQGNLLDLWNNSLSKFSVDYSGLINTQNGINFANINNKPSAQLSSNVDPIGNGGSGSYSTLASLPQQRYFQTSVASNGYLFVNGGLNAAGSVQSTIYSAQINADGTIKNWNTIFQSQQRYKHASTVSNGYLFVVGGANEAAASQSTVFSAQIKSDGTVGAWNTLTNIPRVLIQTAAVASNGYLFVVGGSASGVNNTSNSTVYSAPINNNGTIGSFSTLTYLPQALNFHTAAVYNGYLFVAGGTNAAGANQSTVYSAPINSDGTIGSFSTLTYLPQVLTQHAITVNNGYLLVSGGYGTANGVQSTIYSAKINSDGTVGAFATLTYSPQGLVDHAIVASNGYLFITGGYSTDYQSTVYSAPLQSTGLAYNTANTFTSGNLLDVWNNNQSKFSVDYSGLINTQNGINFANISNKPTAQATSQVDPLAAGGTGAYSTLNYLPKALSYFNTFAYNNYLFALGGFGGGNVAMSTVYSAPIRSDGTIGSFNTLTYLPKKIWSPASVVSNGYIFVTGGFDGSDYQSTVYSTPINNNGTINSWTTLSYLPTALSSHSANTYNGYLFVVGGEAVGGGIRSSVYSAPINSNGSIGSFNTLASLPIAIRRSATVVSNGYLFVVGGDNISIQSTVYSAPINSNGTVGTWSTLTFLPQRLYDLTANAYNGHLYVVGGFNTTGQSTVYSAPIRSDGTIGNFSTLGYLPQVTRAHSTAQYNGYLFINGGYISTQQSTVYSTPLQSTGLAYNTANAFTNGNLLDIWNNNQSKFSVDYNGTLNANGGLNITSLNNKPTANLQSQVDPLGNGGIGAYTALTSLPGTRDLANATSYNGYLFITGGSSSGTKQSTVYSAQVKPDGTISAWSTLNYLPQAIQTMATNAYNGYLFVTGGLAAAGQSTVYSAKINSDGTIGNWNTLTYLPGGVVRDHAGSTYNGYLFVMGGFGAAVLSTVYSAPINGDGTIGSWATLSSLPQGLEYPAGLSYNGYLFVTGGINAGATIQSTVYSAPIKTDGTIGSWATLSSLPQATYQHNLSTANGYLYVTGGSSGGNYQSVVYSAKINNDGTINAWTTLSYLPQAINRQSSAVTNGYLYIIGGSNAATQSSVYSTPLQSTGLAYNTANTFTQGNLLDVWNNNQSKFSVDYLGNVNTQSGINFASINNKPTANLSSNADPIGNGGTGNYSTLTSLPQKLSNLSATTYNNYLVVTGGSASSGAYQSTVYSALTKSDGTIGAFSTLTYMPKALGYHSALVYNGYLFVTGGTNGTGTQSTVYSAPIRSDGTIGSFSTLTYLPQVLYAPSTAVYNGYLFVTGGIGAAAQSTVYSAPIRSDGTIGSFSTLTYLPQALSGHYANVYNGYLFIVGGAGATFQSTVYSAPIRSDGTIGSFSTLTYLPAARYLHSGAIYNGYLFVTGGYNSSVQSTVYSAPIRADGTIGSFSTLSYLPAARYEQSSVMINGYLFVSGGNDGTATYLSSVYSTPLQSTAFAFNTQNQFNSGNLLDVWNNNQSKFSVDYAGNLTTAGKFTSQVVPSGDGSVGSFTTTTFLPSGRYYQGTSVYNGYLYALGGHDGTNYQSTVFNAPIRSDGTIGTWSTLTYLPQLLSEVGTTAYNGYLFTTGGWNGSAAQSTVYSSKINADGTLAGTFSTLTYLPIAVTLNSTTSYNGYLFVTGGWNASGGAQSTVYSAPIKSDGTIGSFSTLTYLPQLLYTHSINAYNGYLFVVGGTDGSSSQSTVYSAPINSDGTIGSFSTLTYLPQILQRASVNVYNGYLYVAGGLGTANAYQSTVYSAPIKSDGTIGSWGTISYLPGISARQSSSVYNGYIFVSGGFNGTNTYSTVYTASLTTSRAFVFNTVNQFPESTSLGGSASLFTLQNNGTGMFNVDAQGNGRFAGNIYASGAILGTPGNVGDLAENITASDTSIEAADVVSTDGNGNLVKSSSPYDGSLVGIVSTNPSLTFAPDMPNGKPVALSGKVPVKVTAANGEIKPGDYLTSSSIPGIAQKATKPGYVIGKALESYSDSEVGKIMVLVNLSFADPNNFLANFASKIALSDKGELTVTSLKTTNISLVEKINLQEASNSGLLANDTSLSSSVSVIPCVTRDPDGSCMDSGSESGMTEVGFGMTNIAEKLANISTSFTSYDQKIQNLEAKVASLSAQLADQGKASTSTSSSEVANIAEASTSANLALQDLTQPSELLSTPSSLLTLDNLNQTSQATFSGLLSSYDLNVSNTFKSLGQSILADTTIAGDLTVDGTLSISGDSVSSIGTLFIQNSSLATNLNIFNGNVTIDKDGNIVAKGTITTPQLKIQENTSAGSFTLEAGKTEAVIENSYVTEKSIVLVTPSKPLNQTIGITDKITGKSFKVVLKQPEDEDIEISYVIIGQ